MFAVIGCPDPDLSEGAWLKRFGHELLIGCKDDPEKTWLLTCVKGKYEGHVGVCPTSPGSAGESAAGLPPVSGPRPAVPSNSGPSLSSSSSSKTYEAAAGNIPVVDEVKAKPSKQQTGSFGLTGKSSLLSDK